MEGKYYVNSMKMQSPRKLLITAAFLCCKKCLKDLSNFNKMYFYETVNKFFPKDMQNREIEIEIYIYGEKLSTGRQTESFELVVILCFSGIVD